MKSAIETFLRRLFGWTGIGAIAFGGGLAPAFGALPHTDASVDDTVPLPVTPLTFERPNYNELQLFAGHSSHSSHSSHASHSSHYSGSGHASHSSHYSGSGGAYPLPQPQSASPSAAPALKPLNQKSAPATANQKLVMVMRVQAKLHELGYYSGPINGHLGPLTKDALIRYQTVKGFAATGKLDDPTLAALGIAY